MSLPSALAGRRFAFHARRYDAAKASIRLRLLGPIAALRARGVDIACYDPAVGPAGYDAIIFSKSYSRSATALVEAARAVGCAVVSDVCDNVLERAERRGRGAKAERIARQLRQADLVSIATPELGTALERQISGVAPRLRVVSDMLEDLDALARMPLSLLDRFRLDRLDRFHARHPGALHCVWFGKSFADVSGLTHLGHAVTALERFAAHAPVTLTICSDSPGTYRRVARDWGIPHAYAPWTLASFPHVLARQRVALIPVVRNSYTAGKTINRPASALRAGLGVVADALPSYEPLRPFIALDDWQGGLERYAHHWADEGERIAAGNAWLDAEYGAVKVAREWEAVLEQAVAGRPFRRAS